MNADVLRKWDDKMVEYQQYHPSLGQQQQAPWDSVFIHIPLFASAKSFSEQRQMEGVIQNDQTPETRKTEGMKGYRKQELHGDHRAEQNVSMNWCTWVSRDRRRLRGKQVFRFTISKQLAYKTICITGTLGFQFARVYFFLTLVSCVWSFSMLWRVFTCCGFCQCFQHGFLGN